MASRLAITLSLLAIYSLSISASPATSIVESDRSSDDKVKVGFYYESLCPYSAKFIVEYLNKLVEDKKLLSVVDLHLSPWGNARLKSNNSFTCQHGPVECLLNTVEACAINVWPELDKHFPFIYCVEKFVYERKYLQWESCFEILNLDRKPVVDCYNGRDGKELELQYAKETSSLEPPHQYVPWVVVDGQPLYEDYENFISYICKAYKGSTSLQACSETSLKTSRWGKAKAILSSVSYKDNILTLITERVRTVVSMMEKMRKSASV